MKKIIYLSLFCAVFSNITTAQIDPNWETEVTGYEQPAWFNSQRVQIHSRLAAPYYNNPDHAIYSNWAGSVIDAVGANTFTRHVKTNDGPIHWQSAWGEWTTLANTRNIIQEAIDEAETHNKNMIGYYNHYTDGYLRDNFPNYKCKDVSGNDIVRTGRGTMICLNSPAVDLLETRLVEFINMGGKGIYFDEIHMPREGCWCGNCTTKYTNLTGNPIPTLTDFNNNTQTYKDYQNFNNASVVEAFYQWRQAIETANPEAVMIIGSNTYPKMINRHLNSDLMRVSHAHKSEWELANKTLNASASVNTMPTGIAVPNHSTWRALSYILSRDAGDGRPAHYWIPGMSFVPDYVLKAATAGMISFGNIANIDMKEQAGYNPPDMDFVDAVTYGNTVSPAFEGTKPLRWLMIHYNEAALEQHLGHTQAGWTNFLSSFHGAYYSGQQQKLPVGVITDSQLELGLFQGAKVLFLPNTSNISSAIQAQIDAFETNGGVVISEANNWHWQNGGAAFNNAKNALQGLLDGVSERPFMQSNGGGAFYNANYFIKEGATETKYLASYSNNLEWIIANATSPDYSDSGYPNSAPSPLSGITLTVRSNGTPTSVRDVVTNTPVSYTISGGELTLTVPTFQDAALIEITYPGGTLSTTDFETSNYKLYPNPVKHRLNIKDLATGSKLTVTNMLGQVMITKENTSSIDVSSLASGMYHITINNDNDNEQKTMKFIKE
ncbi:MAG: T9SS type A sorting domain-containing protein [Xanthomarina gelatinilytica]|uniref:T9SS type A sorting domain-containing protein n=1 Tax=Xanthomarina gelatinilytica TaxID=1137281 RepID=UPI003A875F6C